MSALEVVDKIARGDVYRRLITFREGLTIRGDGAGLRRRPASARRRSSKRPRTRRRADSRSRSATPAISRAICSPRPIRCAARRRPIALVGPDGELVQADRSTTGLRDAAKAHGLTRPGGGDAGRRWSKRKRLSPDERPLVAAVYLNRTPTRHADAGRSHGDLRAAAGRPIQRQPPPRRSAVRLAVQHLSVSRACRPVRLPLRARPRSRPSSNPARCDYLYFVSRNDGSHVFATDARRAQSQRAASGR